MHDRYSLPGLGEALDFMRLIWAVDHELQRASKRMQATLGVTGQQRLVIRIIGRFPGLPASHLAGLLHVHPSTLTGILKRLERQGLIRRRADSRDARRFLVSLTERGRGFDIGMEGTIEAGIQHVIERTHVDTLRSAREVLASLAVSLGSIATARRTEQDSHVRSMKAI
jgi:DNA-binding MarR family transcriptional regulator